MSAPGTITGTAGDDLIDDAYLGDPDGDRVDGEDATLPDAEPDDDLILAGDGNDFVYADAGDDAAFGGGGNDTLYGGSGGDTLAGDEGNDVLDGGSGADVLTGGEGDDLLVSGTGRDVVLGDSGNDRLVGGNDADVLFGGSGDDTVSGDAGDDIASGGAGHDTIYGGVGADTLTGDDGDDELSGGDGGDSVNGGAGDDVISGDAGADVLGGEAGSDTIYGGDGADSISGGAGDDTLLGGEGNDALAGGSENDLIFGEGGSDSADGGAGNDLVYGGLGSDASIGGGEGDDTVSGRYGDDTLFGGTGNDTLFGDIDETGTGARQFVIYGLGTSGAGLMTGPNGTFTFGASGPITIEAVDDDDRFEDVSGAGGSPTDSGPQTLAYAVTINGVTYPAGTPIYAVSTSEILNATTGQAGHAWLIQIGSDPSNVVWAFDIPVHPGDSLTWTTGPDADDVSGLSYEDLTQADGTTAVGDDSLSGGDGDDTAYGADGDDSLAGDAGSDRLYGGEGEDRIDGGADDDWAWGGEDDDWISGGTGADTLDGGGGADTLYGGTGADSLAGGTGGDTLFGGGDADSLAGGAGADRLSGGAGADALFGGDDADTLDGGVGADTLAGGTGNDAIEVAQGDVATGGDGDDTFTLADLGEAGAGSITVTGGEGSETLGDTLVLGHLADLSTLVYTNTDDGAGGFSGYVTLDDGTILYFNEIEHIICFAAGTRIATARGARAVESLRLGDLVVTRDHGLQPVRWVGARAVPAQGRLAPIRLRPGALPGLERDLVVSPQHRMLLRGPRAELLLGESEVLVPALHLVDGLGVTQEAGASVTYCHLLFDRHEVIYAEGAASESFHPGEVGLSAVEGRAREEIFAIFPELRALPQSYGPAARRSLRRHEARLIRA